MTMMPLPEAPVGPVVDVVEVVVEVAPPAPVAAPPVRSKVDELVSPPQAAMTPAPVARRRKNVVHSRELRDARI
jgi:hypothetical protein